MFNPAEHFISLKGKDYLQVMWRLVWFRDQHPNWNIDTMIVNADENTAVFMCKIYDENGKQVSSGHGSESRKDFGDFLEKAETKAIGRALAILGYGTQFAPELDEGERIVDSPVQRKKESIEQYIGYIIPYGAHEGEKLGDVYKTDRAHIQILLSAAKGKCDTATVTAIDKIEAYIKTNK